MLPMFVKIIQYAPQNPNFFSTRCGFTLDV